MPNLHLNSISYNKKTESRSNYIVSSLVSSLTRPRNPRLIKSLQELDFYFKGATERRTYSNMLRSGTNLLLTGYETIGGRESSLRLHASPDLNSSHPTQSTTLEVDPLPTVTPESRFQFIKDQGLTESLHKYRTSSFNISLSIRGDSLSDESYVKIPKVADSSSSSVIQARRNNLLIYCTPFHASELLTKKPDDFKDPIDISEVGESQIAIDSNEVSPSEFLQLVKDWYDYYSDTDSKTRLDQLISSDKIRLIGPIGDPNYLRSEIKGEILTVIFKTLVPSIQQDSLKYDLVALSDWNLDQELLAKSLTSESVISFKLDVLGDIEVPIEFIHIQDFEFRIKFNFLGKSFDKVCSLWSGDQFNSFSYYLPDLLKSEFPEVTVVNHLNTILNFASVEEISEWKQKMKLLTGIHTIKGGDIGSNIVRETNYKSRIELRKKDPTSRDSYRFEFNYEGDSKFNISIQKNSDIIYLSLIDFDLNTVTSVSHLKTVVSDLLPELQLIYYIEEDLIQSRLQISDIVGTLTELYLEESSSYVSKDIYGSVIEFNPLKDGLSNLLEFHNRPHAFLVPYRFWTKSELDLISDNYLKPLDIVGIYNIRLDRSDDSLVNYLPSDSLYYITFLGELLDMEYQETIPVMDIFCRSLNSGRYNIEIPSHIIPYSDIRISELNYLGYKVNRVSKFGTRNLIIDVISNSPTLDSVNLIIASYIKSELFNKLSYILGEFEESLENKLTSVIPAITSYSPLIRDFDLVRYTELNGLVTANYEVKLENVVHGTYNLNIKITI